LLKTIHTTYSDNSFRCSLQYSLHRKMFWMYSCLYVGIVICTSTFYRMSRLWKKTNYVCRILSFGKAMDYISVGWEKYVKSAKDVFEKNVIKSPDPTLLLHYRYCFLNEPGRHKHMPSYPIAMWLSILYTNEALLFVYQISQFSDYCHLTHFAQATQI
jgi:hypothetical protein